MINFLKVQMVNEKSPRVTRWESRRASLLPEKQSLSILGFTPEKEDWLFCTDFALVVEGSFIEADQGT